MSDHLSPSSARGHYFAEAPLREGAFGCPFNRFEAELRDKPFPIGAWERGINTSGSWERGNLSRILEVCSKTLRQFLRISG